ncbi:MAG: hypothetical protein QM747_05270 [Nocardioides sp.]
MAFHAYPYREEEPRPGRPPVVRPTVDLRVTAREEIMVRSLVDTGAPFCIFSRAIAEAVDVDMRPGRGLDREIRILGGVHNSRLATVGLQLPPFEGVTWDAECAFLYEDLDLSFAGILGQEGFLDRWVASFNMYDGFFVIEERDDFVQRLGIDPMDFINGFYDSEWERPTRD